MKSVFVDTSGIFAWINSRDPNHETMRELPMLPNTQLVITDYIVDEVCTLFVARGIAHQRRRLLEMVENSQIVRMEWVGRDLFHKARDWMFRFEDHPLSFTDCTSFACMESLGITDAATTDHHFLIAGFHPILQAKT
ncbi:MAG: PIN domain-containing protein [bacterium]